MVRLTEQIIRSRAEHNNGEIFSLEEISLHQQDLEKLELLDTMCKKLRILYLHNNVIPKIENVNRLKELEYLNLALNNVQVIEGLEGCESLQKLDLTLNFVVDIFSVEKLNQNPHFIHLYLTGNPCASFEGYREYVIATLPNLQTLDGTAIVRSERIAATQKLPELIENLKLQIDIYRQEEKKRKEEEEAKKKGAGKKKAGFDGRWYTDINNTANESAKITEITDEEAEAVQREGKDEQEGEEEKEDSEFWNESVAFTPESRLESVKQKERKKKKEEEEKLAKENAKNPKKERKLFEGDRIYQMNEGKWDFKLYEDFNDKLESQNVILDLKCPRHCDTSLIDADVQPTYIRVTIKDKILQLLLPREVNPDSSTAKRSQTTGNLLVTMPILGAVVSSKTNTTKEKFKSRLVCRPEKKKHQQPKREVLEVPNEVREHIDISKICLEEKQKSHLAGGGRNGVLEVDAGKTLNVTVGKGPHREAEDAKKKQPRPNSEDFIDNPDVPPLI
eukprot:Nk52_evm15s1073 gene=Nk52_evmTU15s1073